MDGVEKAAFRGDKGADEVNNKTSQRERSNDSTASEAASGGKELVSEVIKSYPKQRIFYLFIYLFEIWVGLVMTWTVEMTTGEGLDEKI